ncbi:aryl-sulfate sulfotransferase [Salinimicrobium sp. HB62]|uniref:aryl-sulfate sulfotransferase n=1 Tax=Salinimicrobium sp. HB62 TaxID=3077781 RepID=UPI002D7A2C9C|nr:aryl-sulfate sulfotransferase [Salinimicrobium sp. HB62]
MRQFLLPFLLLLIFSSCTQNDVIEEVPPKNEVPVQKKLAGRIIIHDLEKTEDAYVLVNDAINNRVYIIEKNESEILYEWKLPSGIGNDAVLMEDGNLLVALTDPEPAYNFGGYGGRIAIVKPNGDLIWNYTYSDEKNLAHHDIEMLPNGNILFIVWEKKDSNEIRRSGYTGEEEVIYTEKILEVNPANNEIVWEWDVWDHLVQEEEPLLANYGSVAGSPAKVNVNYVDHLKEGLYNGDIFHANGLEYDKENDLIFLSVNYFSEVWIIDHSTTTEEAKGSTGGDYGKGGDLVYRIGNPAAYDNSEGERMFYHNHHPNLVPGKNNLLVFSNGIPSVDAHSIVYELELPEVYELRSSTNNELNVAWSFAHEDFFSAKVSGARRLPNGNTLITEGSAGYWEVTNTGEVVWRFEGDGFFWRGYHYAKNDSALGPLGL